MPSLLKRFDKWLDTHVILLLLLSLVLILRIPNLFEPYWYGDEGIYLTIGNAMKDGQKLYADIIDHKTPLIYYLAMIPDQKIFRLLNIFWMLSSTVFFHHLAKKMIKPNKYAVVATLCFILLTSLPALEGNIPNGELFVMGFILLGSYLLSKTTLFTNIFDKDAHAFSSEKNLDQIALKRINLKNFGLLLSAGISFGLGILTKVPGLFDVLAFFVPSWYFLTNNLSFSHRKFNKWISVTGQVIARNLIILLGVILTISASIFYFIIRGSGEFYLQYGLLYNFRYATSWGLPFDHPLMLFLFTLIGKALVVAIMVAILMIFKKYFSTAFQFAVTWTMFTLFASLLSNRPYPHYFLQVVPPLALLVGLSLSNLVNLFSRKKITACLFQLLVSLIVFGLIGGIIVSLRIGFYPTIKYYRSTYDLISNKITEQQYRQSFNHLMQDNYTASKIIGKSGDKKMFIWGTNPMLYAMTGTYPTGRFTVSFHIKDFQAQAETLEDVIANQPMFIVTMKDEQAELPGLNEYLFEYYLPNNNFDNFILWKKSVVE